MIRPYQPGDEPAVRRICIETGLKGQLDQIFCDAEAFADLWLNPFLRQSQPIAWVAEREGEVVGYLVGHLGGKHPLATLRQVLPTLFKVTLRALSGKYAHHPPSLAFVLWLWFRAWREAPAMPRHLPTFHFNLATEARDGRLGDDLMGAFFAAARAQGHREFSIQVFVRPGKRDLKFYDRLACRLLDVKPTTVLKEPACFASLVRAIPDRLDWQRVRRPLSLRTRLILPPGVAEPFSQVWAPDAIEFATHPPHAQPGEVVIHVASHAELPLDLVARVHQQIQAHAPLSPQGTGTLDNGTMRVTYTWSSADSTNRPGSKNARTRGSSHT